MKFSKKLSLLLGASKAMKVEKDDNASVKESNNIPVTEVRKQTDQSAIIDQPEPSIVQDEVKKENVKANPSKWGKLKSDNDNNPTSQEATPVEKVQTIENQLDTPTIGQAVKQDNPKSNVSKWGALKANDANDLGSQDATPAEKNQSRLQPTLSPNEVDIYQSNFSIDSSSSNDFKERNDIYQKLFFSVPEKLDDNINGKKIDLKLLLGLSRYNLMNDIYMNKNVITG